MYTAKTEWLLNVIISLIMMCAIISSSSITTDYDKLHRDRFHNYTLPNSMIPSWEATIRSESQAIPRLLRN
jgi:hypothetical protein